MGSWGFKLTQGDTYLDIVDSFKTYYNLGDSTEKIVESILQEYASIDNDDSEKQDLVFGIAYGLWLINALEEKHLKELDEIITHDIGMCLWKEQGEKSYEKRKKALLEFRKKIETPRQTLLKRKAIKQYMCPFDVGDIIVFNLENNHYSGAVVLTREGDEAHTRVKYGTQYIVFSSSIFMYPPTIEDILDSHILYIPAKRGYYIRKISAKDVSFNILKKIEKIGTINLDKSILSNFNRTTYCFNSGTIDEYLSDLQHYQTKHDRGIYTLKDIVNCTNTWDEMLINRYDFLESDIRKELRK